MEGRIHPTLAFVRFPQMLRCQRQALDGDIRKLSRCHIVYPGLAHLDQHGQRIEIPIDSISGRIITLPPPPPPPPPPTI